MQLINEMFDLVMFLRIQAIGLKDQKIKNNKNQPNKKHPNMSAAYTHSCILSYLVILQDITHLQKLDGLSPLTAVIPRFNLGHFI